MLYLAVTASTTIEDMAIRSDPDVYTAQSR